MSEGWCADLPDAEDYFIDERLETDVWDSLGSALKLKALINSYNRLYYDPRWNLPTYIEATTAELVILRKANCEMAYYLAQHLSDEDRRKGIQAQGVIEAGIVKEKYDKDMLMAIAVPPWVIGLLAPWSTDEYAGSLDLARDEDESVHTKVHNF